MIAATPAPVGEDEVAAIPGRGEGEARVVAADEVQAFTASGWRLVACVTEEEVESVCEPIPSEVLAALREKYGYHPPPIYDRRGRVVPAGHQVRDLVVRRARFVLVRDAESALSLAQEREREALAVVQERARELRELEEQLREREKELDHAQTAMVAASNRAEREAVRARDLADQVRRLEEALGAARDELGRIRRHLGERAVADILGGKKG